VRGSEKLLIQQEDACCRWHWEMAQLNVVARTLIRLAFGTALPSGTHQDALESYARATELNPGRLIHRWAISASQVAIPRGGGGGWGGGRAGLV